jgi:sugar fermentation stimulation protein A
MKFEKPLLKGVLIRRYKRFLADIEFENGTVVTAHCANTGSMMQVSCLGSEVMISQADNPDRKTAYDWQMILVNGLWAGINTAVPNILLKEGFENGAFPQFKNYDTIMTEKLFDKHWRPDAVLSGSKGIMIAEAKNVTLVEGGCALFPDAVTSRGLKHLERLSGQINKGCRASVFFLSQRMDAECIGVASHIDPEFAAGLRCAVKKGLEIISWRAKVSETEIVLDKELPFEF